MNLFPYQHTGVTFLAERDFALLADDMGLGKSAQVLRAAAQEGVHDALIVCPASVRENWRRQVRLWGSLPDIQVVFDGKDTVRSPVVIVSYDSLRTKRLREQLLARTWDLLVLDEAHFLKERTAARTMNCLGADCHRGGLAGQARRVWYLTGTPTPNNVVELWPMLHRAGIVKIGYWQFLRLCCQYENTPYGVKIHSTRAHIIPKLKALLVPFALRRRKIEVMPELPPLMVNDIDVQAGLPDAEMWYPFAAYKPDQYEEKLQKQMTLYREIIKRCQKNKRLNLITQLENESKHLATARQYLGLCKVQPIADIVREWIVSGEAEKVVVFAIHRCTILALHHALEGLYPLNLHGGTPPTKRQAHVDRFSKPKGRTRVLIANINTAGTGIDLTAAHHVVFAEASWTPSDNAQAMMRCHRIGQTMPVNVSFVSIPGSLDEVVMRVMRRKAADVAKLFGASSVAKSATR